MGMGGDVKCRLWRQAVGESALGKAKRVSVISGWVLFKELELTHGGFYRHFANKEQLYTEALAFSVNDAQRQLSGRVAGKEAAHQIALTGAIVIPGGRNEAKLNQTIAEIKQSSGNQQIDGILADLSTVAGMCHFAEQFKARYQQLDILLNNASAIFTERKLTEDGYERTFALNHLSYFMVTQLLLDTMLSSTPARIINVASDVHTSPPKQKKGPSVLPMVLTKLFLPAVS